MTTTTPRKTVDVYRNEDLFPNEEMAVAINGDEVTLTLTTDLYNPVVTSTEVMTLDRWNSAEATYRRWDGWKFSYTAEVDDAE